MQLYYINPQRFMVEQYFGLLKKTIDLMAHISIKYTFLMLSLFYIQVTKVCAQTLCDTNSNYEYVETNDSTIELRVSINGLHGKAEYYIINNEESLPLPAYQGRYKDCMVFMRGYGQHFRLLTVFQVSDGIIKKEDYEQTMCMEPDKKESYLFFYDGQPIKMTYNYKNSKVKFKTLRNRNKYKNYKGKTIVSCKNKFYIDS